MLHPFPDLPLAPRLAAVADEARQAGVQGTVGFNYRNAPAVAAARELVGGGQLGMVTHARFRLFSDYAAHPEGALTWRYERARGGSGVLGDLAAHGVDLVWHLLGEVDSVVADTAIFLPERARHGAYAAFQPGSDLAMGFDDLKVIEAHNFLRSIAEGTPHGTTLADAVRSAATLDAMARSAETGTWVEVADT